jgi:hypothetical protein
VNRRRPFELAWTDVRARGEGTLEVKVATLREIDSAWDDDERSEHLLARHHREPQPRRIYSSKETPPVKDETPARDDLRAR